MKLYGGIDLHSNNSVIHLVSEDGDSHFKKRVTNDLTVKLARACFYILRDQVEFDVNKAFGYSK
jgi:hypothetical protein